jgi:hypothetical protein
MPFQLAQYALYSAAAISAVSVVGHTQMGFELVFPSLRKAGEKDKGAASAKIGWLEGNQVFSVMDNCSISPILYVFHRIVADQSGILYTKWARFGITDKYERAILILTVSYQIACGTGFARAGIYKPLLALWLGPGLATVSQLL